MFPISLITLDIWIELGKTYPFSFEEECCGSLDLPEGGSEAITHMDNSQVHMEDWR